MTTFSTLGLHKDIERALTENNITTPTEIQAQALPVLLKGRTDFIGLAQTGTGKTAAFGLPLLQHINASQPGVQALVLAPTRELGRQITQQLGLFAQHLRHVTMRAVYGGTPLGPQIRALKRPPHIVVATPGRLIDLVAQQAIRLDGVRCLVLDEADEMLSMGFQPAINKILTFLPKEKSIWLFSATMPPEIRRLVHRYMAPDHVQVKSSSQHVVNANIEHQYMVCPDATKPAALQAFLAANPGQQTLVFCRTKATTQRLAQRLARGGVQADALQGDLSQRQRERVMRRFQQQQLQVLVATDVAARGIDVKDLPYVVHYNLPEQAEYYTHRSGRTARAGQQGVSLALVTRPELKQIRQLARTLRLSLRPRQGPDQGALAEHRVQAWAEKVLATAPLPSAQLALASLAERAFKDLTKPALIAKLVGHLVG